MSQTRTLLRFRSARACPRLSMMIEAISTSKDGAIEKITANSCSSAKVAQTGAQTNVLEANDETTTTYPPQNADPIPPLTTKGLAFLCILRFSSAWSERSIAFAIYLFLVPIFPSTLVPASAFGLLTTASGILFSNYAGTLIDKYTHHRLGVVRWSTVVQKLSSGVVYALLLVLLRGSSTQGSNPQTGIGEVGKRGLLAVTILFGCFLKISTVCLALSMEREWPSAISRGSSDRLTKMNTWLRRVDLICDLLSPLFVSALAAGVNYIFAASFLAGMALVSFIFEMIMSGITYRHFPELQVHFLMLQNTDYMQNEQAMEMTHPLEGQSQSRNITNDATQNTGPLWRPTELIRGALSNATKVFQDFKDDITEFSKLPVFFTSLSIASIYLTVLSFDGTMLTYLKSSSPTYTDPFLAAQRAACTIAGLTGTLLFPLSTRKIGLVRTGSWGIWSEFVCLVPVVVALYVLHLQDATNSPSSQASEAPVAVPPPHWNAAMLFGGMALSRIGLWIFDLSQVQILQESLENHPRRNRLTSIQFIMQDAFDMGKYAVTIGLARPSQFKWAGLISALSVFTGGCLYVFGYAKRVRGHVGPHWRWLEKFKAT